MYTKRNPAWTLFLLSTLPTGWTLSFEIPSTPPVNSSGILSSAPVGVSFEFFAFPSYMQDVPATVQCLANLEAAAGVSPTIRIGGTTQDRATYDSTLQEAVSYTVSSAGAAPDSLTYGPSFFSLANSLDGPVILGLNRRLDNISNSIAAAQTAVGAVSNLSAFELGNEPDAYSNSDPIAEGNTWSSTADASSQVSWQESIASAIGKTDIIQAGVFSSKKAFNIQELSAVEGSAAAYVKSFSDHYYPQTAGYDNLELLMNHTAIKNSLSWAVDEISAAKNLSKDFVMGETNSATGIGGGADVSPTYGAALWVLDYVLQAVLIDIKELYFHQGTIGNCRYCWWGRYDMGAPYYGAYMASLALSGASQIAEFDTGDPRYAAYAIYSGDTPVKVLLYNSDYFTGGSRDSVNFTISGIPDTSATAQRLTSSSSTNRVDQGATVTIAGQWFANGTCIQTGTESLETTAVSGGEATFTVAAAEALLISIV